MTSRRPDARAGTTRRSTTWARIASQRAGLQGDDRRRTGRRTRPRRRATRVGRRQAFLLAPGTGARGRARRLARQQPDLSRRQRRPGCDRRPGDAGRLPRLLGPPVGAGLPDRRHRREALLQQDAPELPQLVLHERRRQPLGRRADAVLQEHAGRLDELRRRLRLRHQPQAPVEGCVDRPDAGSGRHRHARPCREPRRRSDRSRGDARVGPLRVRSGRDLHRPYAARHDRDRSARLLRLPHADDQHRRSRQPVPDRVRLHPLAERELAGPRAPGAAACTT